MQWILVLIADALTGIYCYFEHQFVPNYLLTEHDERKALFTDASTDDPELPYTPLLRSVQIGVSYRTY